MIKAEKEQWTEAFRNELKTAKIAVATKFQGMTVEQITLLRRKLEAQKTRYKVLKNSLARRAVKGTAFEALEPHLKFPVGLAYTDADPVSAAKAVSEFQKNEEIPFSVIVAYMDGKEMKASEFKALAALPSREQMLAKLMGSMLAPAQNWVNVLAAVPRQFVTVLAAVRDQKEKQGS